MKHYKNITFIISLFLVLTIMGTIRTTSQTFSYKVIDTIKIGGEGGWDYLTIDTAMHRLFITRSSHVQILDLNKKIVTGDIPKTTGVHGVALVPKMFKGYTSNGRDSSVTVFSYKTLDAVRNMKVNARNPDAIRFDEVSGRVFTFNGGSNNATAIDAATDEIAGMVPFDGKPEFAVTDGKGKMYVNIEDKSEITAFDTKTLKVLNTWSVAPGEEPSGLAIDREHNRLFSVCGNKMMVISDCESGKVIATVPIGERVDGVAFDPGTGLAFSSNGEGTVTVVHEDTPDKFTVVGTVPTQKGARTIAVDESTHKVYVVTATYGDTPPVTAENPHPRPAIVPDSFVVLVLGQ